MIFIDLGFLDLAVCHGADEALARALQAEEDTSYYASETNVPGAPVQASGKKGTVPGWTGHLPPWMSQSSSGTPGAMVNEAVSMSGESNTFRLNSVSNTLNILRGNKGKTAKTHKVQRRNLGGGKSGMKFNIFLFHEEI